MKKRKFQINFNLKLGIGRKGKKETAKEKKKRRSLFARKPPLIIEEIAKPDPVIYLPLKPEYTVVKTYYVYEPIAKISIARLPDGTYQYFVVEPPLLEDEKEILSKLSEIMLDEMKIEQEIRDVRLFVINQFKRVIERYSKKFELDKGDRRAKMMYYLNRNLLGYGPLDPIMRDPYIEDITCNGVNTPLYVWHREFEYIATNLVFTNMERLNETIARLAHLGGKHVSVAFPLVDAILPGGHRLAATYGSEVSHKGPTFTIRKFREKPITIIDLLHNNVFSPEIAAYLWLLIENKRTILIAGGTGAGKTTLLNALLMFVKPGMKIVTIEDIPELRLQHDNWTQLVSRASYSVVTEKGFEIGLFDLVKLSLRYRPDYIVVGEIRGEEAFVLFQAIATGHGGITTIHAESLEYAIKRLMSPPMNIPKTYLHLVNAFIRITPITMRTPDGKATILRKVTDVEEILETEEYQKIFQRDPLTDTYTIQLEQSRSLHEISIMTGKTMQELIEEIERRKKFLQIMTNLGMRDLTEIRNYLLKYYYDPKLAMEELYSRIV